MRVVVVGGTGNLGTAVVRRLVAADAVDSVGVVARRIPDDDPGVFAAVTATACDIATDDLRPVFAGADAVVHLAWLFQPTHEPEVTWQANAVGTARVLDAAAGAGVRQVVVASSVGAYSPSPEQQTVDESWPTHGASAAAYCREKAYLERLLDAFEAAHPSTAVVRIRPSLVFQRQSAQEQRRLFAGPLLPGSLLRPALIPVLPIPAGLKVQAIHADDVASAVAAALLAGARGPFNLAADGVLDKHALADLFAARAVSVPQRLVRMAVSGGWHAHLVAAPPEMYDAFVRLPIMDTGRARRELGWAPRTPAKDVLALLLAALRGGESGPTPALSEEASGPARASEFASGVGERA